MDDNNLDIEKILNKYPNRIPIILISHNKKIKLNKNRYLVHPNMTMSMFIFTLLRNNNLRSSDGIYLTTVNGVMVSTQDNADYLYHHYKSSNKALFLNIHCENTFG